MRHRNETDRKYRLAEQKGFTLIELLVVVGIIGILVAIALPQFAAYRAKSIDGQMKSDLKNVATAMEAYFSDRHIYPNTIADVQSHGFQGTTGVTLVINPITVSTYTVTASKPGGTQVSFTYDSVTGHIN